MACHRPGNKPLSEPMMVSSLMHICVTQPQWVDKSICIIVYSVCIITEVCGIKFLLKLKDIHQCVHAIRITVTSFIINPPGVETKYSGRTRSKPWLLMPWLLAPPGHLHTWYRLCWIDKSLSSTRKDFNHLCYFNMRSKYYSCWPLLLGIAGWFPEIVIYFLFESGSVQWIFSQHCGYWWTGALASGHQ